MNFKEILEADSGHFRFAPCPNGSATLGHLKGLLLLDDLRGQLLKKNKPSTLYLRFDDNNGAEDLQPAYYDSFLQLIKTYQIPIDDIFYASKNFPSYENAVKKLLVSDNAFFCICASQKCLFTAQDCLCSENKQLQKTELDGDQKASFVIKFKSKKEKPYVIYRKITDSITKQSYFSPTIALQGPVDDHLQHRNILLRGRDLEPLTKRQKEIHECLYDTNYPRTYYWGRIDVWNSKTKKVYKVSKSELGQKTQFELPNLKAFEIRGYTPGAIKNWLLSYGLTKHDIKIDIIKLNYFQKRELSAVTQLAQFSEIFKQQTGYYKSHWNAYENAFSEKRCFYYWNKSHALINQYY